MIKEILLGIAIGDAFGAGVEFQDRDWIRQHVDFSKFVNARDQIKVAPEKKEVFTKNYTAWEYTDDTEMTIGLINALNSGEVFSEDLLVQKWKEEYDLGKAQKGYGRNGHGSMSWYYSGAKTIEEVRDFQRDRPNPGNAPAMRSVPLGLLRDDLINEYAAINANATHPNKNAVLSSQCIARASEYVLIKKGDRAHVIDYCFSTVNLNEEYKAYLSKVNELSMYENLNTEEFTILCGSQPIQAPYFLPGINGVPSDSKFTAGAVLYVLKNSKNPFEALKKSVLLGGDVDSVASITTGIMAGRFGLKGIPQFMINTIENLNYLEQVAEKFEQNKNLTDEIRNKEI